MPRSVSGILKTVDGMPRSVSGIPKTVNGMPRSVDGIRSTRAPQECFNTAQFSSSSPFSPAAQPYFRMSDAIPLPACLSI